MRVLVACECSGRVREAFRKKGHDAWSCDIDPAEDGGNHIQGNCLKIIEEGWDLMICHPPCTHLCVSGAWLFPKKKKRQRKALDFVLALLNAPIPRICLENPIGIISTTVRPADQIIQPYQFGESFQKSTCLWLKNLPKLIPTNIVDKGEMVTFASGKVMPKWISWASAKDRSRTFQGIANAMAEQWNEPFQKPRGFGISLPHNFKRNRYQ